MSSTKGTFSFSADPESSQAAKSVWADLEFGNVESEVAGTLQMGSSLEQNCTNGNCFTGSGGSGCATTTGCPGINPN